MSVGIHFVILPEVLYFTQHLQADMDSTLKETTTPSSVFHRQ